MAAEHRDDVADSGETPCVALAVQRSEVPCCSSTRCSPIKDAHTQTHKNTHTQPKKRARRAPIRSPERTAAHRGCSASLDPSAEGRLSVEDKTSFEVWRQTDRQTGKETDRQTDRQTGRRADRRAGRQTDRHIERQTDKQTDKQTDR
jgi:hypothetical protein